jgi:hypothetical protein
MNTAGMKDIHILIKALIFFQAIDTGMHDDPPDPAFKSALALKCVYLGKNFDKSLLQHVLGILPIVGKPIAYSQHFRAVPVVQLPLGSSLVLETA